MSTQHFRGGFSASQAAVVGRYTYRPDTDAWTWSDGIYRIHGFDPGAVVPTTELVMSHIHPEDREAAWEAREALMERDEPYAFLHRIVTADRAERVVMAAGHLTEDTDGARVVLGHLVDLTEVRREAVAGELDSAVHDFTEHRAVIEQAKGVLTQLYSVDTDTAFDLLRAFSMHTNTRLRNVAATLVEAASANDTPTKGRSPCAQDMLEQLLADREPAQG